MLPFTKAPVKIKESQRYITEEAVNHFWQGFEKRAAEGDRYLVNNDYAQIKTRPQTHRVLKETGKGALTGGLTLGTLGALTSYLANRKKPGKKLDKLIKALKPAAGGGIVGGSLGGSYQGGKELGRQEVKKQYGIPYEA